MAVPSDLGRTAAQLPTDAPALPAWARQSAVTVEPCLSMAAGAAKPWRALPRRPGDRSLRHDAVRAALSARGLLR